MKVCKRCDTEKDLSEFHKNIKMKDGHLNVCRACVSTEGKTPNRKKGKAESKRRSLANEDYRMSNNAYQKKYSQSAPRKQYRNIYRNRVEVKKREKAWRENNKDAIREINKKQVLLLSKSYVVNILVHIGFSKEQISDDLIEVYRLIIKIKRYVKEKTINQQHG